MALFTAPSCLGPFTHEQCSGDLVPGIELDPTLEIRSTCTWPVRKSTFGFGKKVGQLLMVPLPFVFVICIR